MKKALYILIILLSMSICNKISAYTEYKIGDVVPYNGMDFYVIKDSSSSEDSVTMLKAEPLTVDEVNLYGAGHVDIYAQSSVGTAHDNNGYGAILYYTSKTCGRVNDSWRESGCKNDYASSDVKYVVDAWKVAKAPTAIEARLISKDEIETETKEYDCCGGCGQCITTGDFVKYDWMYNSKYFYWTMTAYDNSSSNVWYMSSYGVLENGSVYFRNYGVVRPVITLSKTSLGDEEESIVDDKDNETVDDKTIEKDISNKPNESKTTVKVDNTYMSSSILLIILGFVIASVSVLIIYKLSNKKR